jgi:hypothetical protein
MSREEVLAMLDAGPEGPSELEVEEVAVDASGPPVPVSETALELDDWSLRRGAEVFNGSERIKEGFESLIPEDHPNPTGGHE